MPPWWSKSASKDVNKKANKESFIDTIHRKFKIVSEGKCGSRAFSDKASRRRRSSDTFSDKGLSPLPSTHVSRCQSFAERAQAQPLPLPGLQNPANLRLAGNRASKKSGSEEGCKTPNLPVPRSGNSPNVLNEGDLATASVSSDSLSDSDDPFESRLLSPQVSDYENGNKTAISSPTSVKHKDQSPLTSQMNARMANMLLSNQTQPVRASARRVPNLQIPNPNIFHSAPDSSMSSPSRSPMRIFDPITSPYFYSGHCSSPGSGQNSGHNSIGGDMSGQLFWPHSRSPECSPIPSPRMTSPGPSSRIHSGAVTPLHPRAGGLADDGKQQSHRLPLPPLTIPNSSHVSHSYSTGTTPIVPRSPGRTENPLSPGSRWKKGRLLGRGTFGHVYLGFNSGSGEMCAMKEVTLFSEDAKSKESAQQLGQEIALLSRLRHPNIVQYYGSETVDDKLYIYLEYVSGGSIYKLLQEYGQLGEAAIRSYTHQILSGLAYLHAKNTVHRDIKGANILVDPNGRVKLADFGMAKHITGQSCPLSLKGSPYWMAPEVIKNSNGSNLAVDIWSLGCTVLEMATTKPPWSQYEGVAAMFKIGNSKELPTIPDHLSDDGKDFVRRCLDRNPLHRPTAVKLLEHPFVKNASPLERPILYPEEGSSPATNSIRSLGIGGYATSSSLFESSASHLSRSPRNGSAFSDVNTHKNISCPVSPIGSPLLHSRSPQCTSGRLTPSPISSPRAVLSGSSTPLTGGGNGFHPQTHPPLNHQNENMGTMFPLPQNHSHPKPDMFRGISQNGFLGYQFGGQSVLADRVSQQLLKGNVKVNPLFDLNHGSPVLGHGNGTSY